MNSRKSKNSGDERLKVNNFDYFFIFNYFDEFKQTNDDFGMIDLSEKENYFYRIFKKVFKSSDEKKESGSKFYEV